MLALCMTLICCLIIRVTSSNMSTPNSSNTPSGIANATSFHLGEMYSKLCQCTMVLVHATIHCWVIKDKEGSGVKKVTDLATDYTGKDSELITSLDLSSSGKEHLGYR